MITRVRKLIETDVFQNLKSVTAKKKDLIKRIKTNKIKVLNSGIKIKIA
mgnify:CR=1 FL=1